MFERTPSRRRRRTLLLPALALTTAATVALTAHLATAGGTASANTPDSPTVSDSADAPDAPAALALPPVGAGFDYQIGGAYTPDDAVEIVIRDHEADPAPGLYNICYVNAFQVQPGAEDEWDDDLLLRDADGDVVYDGDWGEAVLDIRTDDRRERIAQRVGTWMESCADRGYQAVEPDNYDTFFRFDDLLTEDDAVSMITLISDRAHAAGLAVAQKNAVELADRAEEAGLDFAVAEECGQWNECEGYASVFDDRVLVVEYSEQGMATACEGWGDRLSVIRRDLAVSPPGRDGYLRETC
ncbi:endo alpha-1,4 polygalactosaminidase [Streptomyces otsuchiensis]|uniref:endo alpha-1,4 polygalactosaminidase n=1 Tax=Streptomyces otsuchiensis TaxID=2681388 RepID=UPI00102F43E8|nr:endo alpha-1,4 polygalactosaminidase [Streptomyces otsuchiensis]